MNIIQFWIIDTIVKGSAFVSPSVTPREESEEPFLSPMDEEDEETETEDLEAGGKLGKDDGDSKSIQSRTASTSNNV